MLSEVMQRDLVSVPAVPAVSRCSTTKLEW